MVDWKRWERDDHKATAWALELSGKMLQEAREENRAALLQVAEATASMRNGGGGGCRRAGKGKIPGIGDKSISHPRQEQPERRPH